MQITKDFHLIGYGQNSNLNSNTIVLFGNPVTVTILQIVLFGNPVTVTILQIVLSANPATVTITIAEQYYYYRKKSTIADSTVKACITHKKSNTIDPTLLYTTPPQKNAYSSIQQYLTALILPKKKPKKSSNIDLEIELQKCWNLKKIRTIPVVIGALGTVSRRLKENLKQISPLIHFNTVQKTTLLGTAHILRNFLTHKDLSL